MALFTFIMEYQGGTYISQVQADNLAQAPEIWAREGDWANIPKAGKKFADKLLAAIEADPPVALEALVNTWCITALIKDELALITFTQTVE